MQTRDACLYDPLRMIHLPALVFPSRLIIPFSCISFRSLRMVRTTTDKTRDISEAEIRSFSFIILIISLCLSVSCIGDKLMTSLVTSSATFIIPKNLVRCTHSLLYLPCPAFFVEVAVVDGFGYVAEGYIFCSFKVGNSA